MTCLGQATISAGSKKKKKKKKKKISPQNGFEPQNKVEYKIIFVSFIPSLIFFAASHR